MKKTGCGHRRLLMLAALVEKFHTVQATLHQRILNGHTEFNERGCIGLLLADEWAMASENLHRQAPSLMLYSPQLGDSQKRKKAWCMNM